MASAETPMKPDPEPQHAEERPRQLLALGRVVGHRELLMPRHAVV
jgi:hypothetical protein